MMDIVLVALLYASTLSTPNVYVSAFVYTNMAECTKDAEEVKTRLMETKPLSDSYVNVQCIVMPRNT